MIFEDIVIPLLGSLLFGLLLLIHGVDKNLVFTVSGLYMIGLMIYIKLISIEVKQEKKSSEVKNNGIHG